MSDPPKLHNGHEPELSDELDVLLPLTFTIAGAVMHFVTSLLPHDGHVTSAVEFILINSSNILPHFLHSNTYTGIIPPYWLPIKIRMAGSSQVYVNGSIAADRVMDYSQLQNVCLTELQPTLTT